MMKFHFLTGILVLSLSTPVFAQSISGSGRTMRFERSGDFVRLYDCPESVTDLGNCEPAEGGRAFKIANLEKEASKQTKIAWGLRALHTGVVVGGTVGGTLIGYKVGSKGGGDYNFGGVMVGLFGMAVGTVGSSATEGVLHFIDAARPSTYAKKADALKSVVSAAKNGENLKTDDYFLFRSDLAKALASVQDASPGEMAVMRAINTSNQKHLPSEAITDQETGAGSAANGK